MAAVMTYRVRAKRWKHGWELHIEGVGVTQSRTLWDAGEMARDLISRREDLPGDAFTVTVTSARLRASADRHLTTAARARPPGWIPKGQGYR
jgi:hypothetical protein